MGKITFFDEKGNIGAGALLLVVGMAGLLISVLVIGVMEKSLVGSRVTNEFLGNMTANETTFTTNNMYSTESTYIAFSVRNNTDITSSSSSASISECGTGVCYIANSETNTIWINMSPTSYNPNQAIWVNYTGSELGALALASGSTIANYVMTALNLISVGLIVLGAGLILSYLTNWRR